MTSNTVEERNAPLICLVDGSALTYRSYYAFIRSPLVNSKGVDTSAVFGFAEKLLDLGERLDPSHMTVAFDTPEPTFRHEAYEDYKATREPAPDEMIEQLPLIHDVIDALGIARIELPGYEADDVIGTIATRAAAAGFRVVIVSTDKDFYQLVTDDVVVFDPWKRVTYDPAAVEDVFGVVPDSVVNVLGLMGDSSDNVPGVPGIGKKTATALIRQFGSLEAVLENVDQVSGIKRRQNLETYAAQARESRELVTICIDAPVDDSLDDMVAGPVDYERVIELFKDLEFPSLMKKLKPPASCVGRDYRFVSTLKELDRVIGELRGADGFAVDLETTSLAPVDAEIVGVALSCAPDTAWYVPVGEGRPRLAVDRVLDRLRPVLEDVDIPKYGQNLKYDYEVFRVHGVELAGIAFDTMIASYLLDPGRRQHNIAAIALEHLGRTVTPIEDLIGKGSSQLSFAEVEVATARDYSCEDAEVAYALTHVLKPEIEEAGLGDLMRDVELPLIPVLARMELAGIAVDAGMLERLGAEFGSEIEAVRAKIWKQAGFEFNIDSPKQVGEVLFERLGLRKGRRTKTGYSTDNAVLTRLALEHEAAALILEYRQLMKLKSGYLDALPKLVNDSTGRVHTSFNQAVAATGRLSSSNPNLQNIPTRTPLGKEIRKAFIASEGKILVSADYSQIELRIMAHLSADANLRAAFQEGKDFHRATAALIFGKTEDDVDPSERDWAKTVNFGIMYGMSPFGLARQLGISNDEAAGFIDRYFERYPGVRDYTNRTIEKAADTGYVLTMLGRRRQISGIRSDNGRIRSMAERTAVNTPIQGSAADLIKVAMIGLATRLAADGIPAEMILQVHDELVLEVDENAVDEAEAAVREEMEGPGGFDLTVPISVNVARGRSWFDVH
ncbi:DNA polymerase I [bacterium]|nr:DNA polymerase I [bacterium]